MSSALVTIRGASKRYGRLMAVDDVSLEVKPGEVFALLVLDEPVNSLDPAGVVEVRALLVDLARDQGVTVFLSSHRLVSPAGPGAREASRAR